MADKYERRLDDYVDVAERLAEFRAKHPEGSLQPWEPFRVQTIAEQTFIVYTAAAYRTPDDRRPGVGTAYEPFPGRTPYTRNSELQNAETSAWGRAIVAALAADTKRGIVTREDVENRTDPTGLPARDVKVDGNTPGRSIDEPPYAPGPDDAGPNAAQLAERVKQIGVDWLQLLQDVKRNADDEGVDVPPRTGDIDKKAFHPFRSLLQRHVEELEKAKGGQQQALA